MTAFWFFVFFSNMIIPLTLLGFGKYFIKTAPKEINALFGYRTKRSMRNKDTWTFAHHYCGKLWLYSGRIVLPISIIVMLMLVGQSKDTIGLVGAILCGLQLIPLVGSMVPTEMALKKTFDKNGNRMI